jgi:phosphopantetheinyl transferase
MDWMDHAPADRDAAPIESAPRPRSAGGRPPATRLPPAADEVVVGLFDLDAAHRYGAGWLAPSERSTASRLVTAELRHRRRASFVFRRQFLAPWLAVDPAAVHFAHLPGGRPCLDRSRHGPVIDFNLSHSGSLMAVAVAHPRLRVGIDVEQLRPLEQRPSLARRILSPRERSLGEVEDDRTLLEYWVAKEAAVKATGDALTIDPRGIEIDRQAARARVPRGDGSVARLHLLPLVLSPQFVGTLAWMAVGTESAGSPPVRVRLCSESRSTPSWNAARQ